jgi:hypothetical protein
MNQAPYSLADLMGYLPPLVQGSPLLPEPTVDEFGPIGGRGVPELGPDGMPPDAIGIGARNSGSCELTPVAGPDSAQPIVDLLNASLPVGMMAGTPTVHVDIQDLEAQRAGDEVHQRVSLYVLWQTGQAGGEAEIDATRGCQFSVGGLQSVKIKAQIRAVDFDGNVRPRARVRLEANVCWKTAASPKPCFCVLPRVSLAAGVEGPIQRIPRQAASMIAQVFDPTVAGNLTAIFRYSNVAGQPPAFRVANPLANGAIVCGGAEFVSFLQVGAAQLVVPTFQLYL